MRSVRAMAAAILVGLMLAPHTGGASTEADHVVQVAATNPDDPNSLFNYTSFYPRTLQVHRGDLVTWRWGAASYFGWHSVTFLPGDMDVAANPAGVIEAVPSFIRPDPETGGLALDEMWVFGKERGGTYGEAACGRGVWRSLPAQDPCSITGTDAYVSSSISDSFFNMPATPEPLSWSARIDLPEGLYRYRCVIHPSMEGRVEVVEDGEPVASKAEVAAAREAQIRQDTERANALVAEISDPDAAFDPVEGVWKVRAGAQLPDRSVQLFGFFPSALTVAEGERVEFIPGTDEPNTVTFARQQLAGSFSVRGACGAASCADGPGYGLSFLAFPFACEQDDPRGGAPSVFTWGPRPDQGCHSGDVEWLISRWMTDQQRATDDAVLTPATFHNSGMLFDPVVPEHYRTDPRTGETFPLTFGATFPRQGDFPLVCLAHPDVMTGSITVVPA